MKKILISIVLLLFLGVSCMNKDQEIKPYMDLPGYKLVFNDELNNGILDTTVWGFHNLGKRRSAINVKNACLINENGELEIRNWTVIDNLDTVHHAGMIETKENFTFGYYEARIKFELLPGTWGAFWIMYNNFQQQFTENDNPKELGTEIDIIEYVPKNNHYVVHNFTGMVTGNIIRLKEVG